MIHGNCLPTHEHVLRYLEARSELYIFCEIAAHTLANSYAHIVQLARSLVAGKDHVLNNYIRRGNTNIRPE